MGEIGWAWGEDGVVVTGVVSWALVLPGVRSCVRVGYGELMEE